MTTIHRIPGSPKPPGERRYVGKCSECRLVTSGLTKGFDARRSRLDAKARGSAVYTSDRGNLMLDCRQCGRPIQARMVRGIYRADVACNAKCLSSTGTTCECSCGGRNHGGGHSAVPPDPSELPKDPRSHEARVQASIDRISVDYANTLSKLAQ